MTHLEDKPSSGIVRKPFTMQFTYRYATLCDVFFYGGDPKHTLADPGAAPTCPGCKAIAEMRKVKP
jgi:hypothetical protein